MSELADVPRRMRGDAGSPGAELTKVNRLQSPETRVPPRAGEEEESAAARWAKELKMKEDAVLALTMLASGSQSTKANESQKPETRPSPEADMEKLARLKHEAKEIQERQRLAKELQEKADELYALKLYQELNPGHVVPVLPSVDRPSSPDYGPPSPPSPPVSRRRKGEEMPSPRGDKRQKVRGGDDAAPVAKTSTGKSILRVSPDGKRRLERAPEYKPSDLYAPAVMPFLKKPESEERQRQKLVDQVLAKDADITDEAEKLAADLGEAMEIARRQGLFPPRASPGVEDTLEPGSKSKAINVDAPEMVKRRNSESEARRREAILDEVLTKVARIQTAQKKTGGEQPMGTQRSDAFPVAKSASGTSSLTSDSGRNTSEEEDELEEEDLIDGDDESEDEDEPDRTGGKAPDLSCLTPWRHLDADEHRITMMRSAPEWLLSDGERALLDGYYESWLRDTGGEPPQQCLTPWRHGGIPLEDMFGLMRCADPAILDEKERALLSENDAERHGNRSRSMELDEPIPGRYGGTPAPTPPPTPRLGSMEFAELVATGGMSRRPLTPKLLTREEYLERSEAAFMPLARKWMATGISMPPRPDGLRSGRRHRRLNALEQNISSANIALGMADQSLGSSGIYLTDQTIYTDQEVCVDQTVFTERIIKTDLTMSKKMYQKKSNVWLWRPPSVFTPERAAKLVRKQPLKMLLGSGGNYGLSGRTNPAKGSLAGGPPKRRYQREVIWKSERERMWGKKSMLGWSLMRHPLPYSKVPKSKRRPLPTSRDTSLMLERKKEEASITVYYDVVHRPLPTSTDVSFRLERTLHSIWEDWEESSDDSELYEEDFTDEEDVDEEMSEGGADDTHSTTTEIELADSPTSHTTEPPSAFSYLTDSDSSSGSSGSSSLSESSDSDSSSDSSGSSSLRELSDL